MLIVLITWKKQTVTVVRFKQNFTNCIISVAGHGWSSNYFATNDISNRFFLQQKSVEQMDQSKDDSIYVSTGFYY